MKPILKIICWIFAIFFLLMAIALISEKETGAGIFSLLTGLAFLPPVWKLVKRATLSQPSMTAPLPKLAAQVDLSESGSIVAKIDQLLKSQPVELKEKQKKSLGKTIYQQLLDKSLSDLQLTGEEKNSLKEVQNYFQLSQDEVNKIHSSRSKDTLKQVIADKYSDELLTAEEQKEISELAAFLNLDSKKLDNLKQKEALAIFEKQLKVMTSDQELSPEEQLQMDKLMKDLDLGDDITKLDLPKSTIREISFFKMFWQANNGFLIPLTNPGLIVQKDEECYMQFPVKLMVTKIVTTGYSSSSSGLSIKVAKGVRYRMGSGQSRAIKEEVTESHEGKVFLTNKRIVFSGGKLSFSLKYEKLLSFDPFKDGVELTAEGKMHTLKFSTDYRNMVAAHRLADIFCAGLNSCLRAFQNPSDTEFEAEFEKARNTGKLVTFD